MNNLTLKMKHLKLSNEWFREFYGESNDKL